MSLSDDERLVAWLAGICRVSVGTWHGRHYVDSACDEWEWLVRPEDDPYWERLAKILDDPEAEELRKSLYDGHGLGPAGWRTSPSAPLRR